MAKPRELSVGGVFQSWARIDDSQAIRPEEENTCVRLATGEVANLASD